MAETSWLPEGRKLGELAYLVRSVLLLWYEGALYRPLPLRGLLQPLKHFHYRLHGYSSTFTCSTVMGRLEG